VEQDKGCNPSKAPFDGIVHANPTSLIALVALAALFIAGTEPLLPRLIVRSHAPRPAPVERPRCYAQPVPSRLPQLRPLGRTGLKTTAVGLGGAPLGDLFQKLTEEEADGVVQEAVSQGITLFDTSPWYGHGLSEHRMGRNLWRLDRDSIVVSTKVGRVYRRPPDPASFSPAPWAGGLPFQLRFDYTATGIHRSYEDSLMRLGLNRVDCLVIHDLDTKHHTSAEKARHRADLEASGWATLDKFRATGEIRAIGAGINDKAEIQYFLDHFNLDFLLVAMPYTLLDQSPLHHELAECQRRGISIVIGSPYASGILATGPLPGAVYNYQPASPDVLKKTQQIAHTCAEFGVTLQQAALQFPLAHPTVTAVIPGATSPDIVKANIGNYRAAIPPELWSALKTRGLLLPDAPVPEAQ
jgi:D-threo-aldose 1-dehydrogenase